MGIGMKKIIFTGGGTAGHVTPNLALMEALADRYEMEYIGSYQGIEKELVEKTGIAYHGISSGKLRRYFDWKNFTDPFRVLKGFSEARKLMKSQKPDLVFSKGGFVAVPVVLAAKKAGVPVIIHESDMTPGLANKLCMSSADKICVNFPETLKYLPDEKAVLTGTPIRKELFQGDRLRGLQFCGFSAEKPVILIIGGSTGAAALNEAVWNLLPTLLKRFQVIHLCGKGKKNSAYDGTEGYVQFEYISKELRDLFAASSLVVSRAGANAICELLALKKPNILVPLTAAASRGDQILNAESFEQQGFSYLLREEELTNETLLTAINEVFEKVDKYLEAMNQKAGSDATQTICAMIDELIGKTK